MTIINKIPKKPSGSFPKNFPDKFRVAEGGTKTFIELENEYNECSWDIQSLVDLKGWIELRKTFSHK